jgi:hypothetical protein
MSDSRRLEYAVPKRSSAWACRSPTPSWPETCCSRPVSSATLPGTLQLAPGGIAAEARQAMENVRAVLEANGSDLDHAVKITVFLADMAEWPAFNAVYTSYFGANLPARSALGRERPRARGAGRARVRRHAQVLRPTALSPRREAVGVGRAEVRRRDAACYGRMP